MINQCRFAQGAYPIDEKDLLGGLVVLYALSPTDNLQHEHSIAVDVELVSELAFRRIFRREVTPAQIDHTTNCQIDWPS